MKFRDIYKSNSLNIKLNVSLKGILKCCEKSVIIINREYIKPILENVIIPINLEKSFID